MGTGWRKALCTSARRDTADTAETPTVLQSPSTRESGRLRLFSSSESGSNPSTPRTNAAATAAMMGEDIVPPSPGLWCRTASSAADETPRLQCGSPMPSPRPLAPSPAKSSPCSPRSPSRFSILRNTFRSSKNRCGLCTQSVKAAQGIAIFIAECSHSFHFPCISAHVQKHQSLVCPVCAATWLQVPPLPEEDDGGGAWRSGTTKQERGRAVTTMAAAVRSPKTSPETKGYSDDEPLFSSSGGSASWFNPIPEAEENDEEEEKSSGDQFQRFKSAPPPERRRQQHWRQQPHQAPSNAGVQVTVNPDIALLSTGRNHDKYAVAVKVKASLPSPPSTAAGTPRAPIDLVMVLDVGGAIAGSKLQTLKRSIRQVILSLTSADRLSIVAFASFAKRLSPLRRMTIQGQRAARRIVDRLFSAAGANSAVSDALRKATRILEDRRERNPVASIMLLSDGPTSEKSSSSTTLSCRSSSTTSSAGTRFAHIEIPADAAAAGELGQETPEEAFARCIGGLLSVVVHDVTLQLTLPLGEITAMYSVSVQPAATFTQGGSVVLGDLYAGEERDLLVEIRVLSSLRQASLKAKCDYRVPRTQEWVQREETLIQVVVPPASAAKSPASEAIRRMFVATRSVTEARRLTEMNDTGTALHLLSSARSVLLKSPAVAAGESGDENLRTVEVELAAIRRRRQHRRRGAAAEGVESGDGEALTPASAWRAAERLAKLAVVRKSLNRVRDLHGFEDARF